MNRECCHSKGGECQFCVNPKLKIYLLPAVNSDFFCEFVLLSSKLIEEFKWLKDPDQPKTTNDAIPARPLSPHAMKPFPASKIFKLMELFCRFRNFTRSQKKRLKTIFIFSARTKAAQPASWSIRRRQKLKTKSERKNVCHTASNLSIKVFSFFSLLEAIFRRFIDTSSKLVWLVFAFDAVFCFVANWAKCLGQIMCANHSEFIFIR